MKNTRIEAGQRIRLVSMRNDPSWNKTLRKGDEGTVESVSCIDITGDTQVWVDFDNGTHIALLLGVDQFEIIRFEECDFCHKNKFPMTKYKSPEFGIVKICSNCDGGTGWIEWFGLDEDNLMEVD